MAGRMPPVDVRDGGTTKWLKMATIGKSAVAGSVRVVYDAVAAAAAAAS